MSAAGIFTAQYHGNGDVEGEKYTFRFKFLMNVIAATVGIIVFAAFDDARNFQQTKLMADRAMGHIQQRRKIADTHLFNVQRADDARARTALRAGY